MVQTWLIIQSIECKVLKSSVNAIHIDQDSFPHHGRIWCEFSESGSMCLSIIMQTRIIIKSTELKVVKSKVKVKVKDIHIEQGSFLAIVHVFCEYGESESICSRDIVHTRLTIESTESKFKNKVKFSAINTPLSPVKMHVY